MDYESDKEAWIEEGKAEGEKTADRRTAMRMLQKNKSIDEILELVDLTRTEIEELAHDMKKINLNCPPSRGQENINIFGRQIRLLAFLLCS